MNNLIDLYTDYLLSSFSQVTATGPYTNENDVVCWHYDHSKGVSLKGLNIVTCLYST